MAPVQSAVMQALPADEIPAFGTFWSWQIPDQPPLPMLTYPDLDVYNLGNGWYAVDDRGVDYQALREQQSIDASLRALEAQYGIDSPPPPPGGGGGLDPGSGPALPAYQHPAGSLWLEMLSVTNGIANVSLHGTVPEMVYEVLSKPILTDTNWALETPPFLGSPGQNWTMVQIPVGTRTNSLFLSARSWLDSDGSGLPDWWQLQWFGHTGVDPYSDDDQDGWLNIEEYSAGQNPKNFDKPRGPAIFTSLDQQTGALTISWDRAPGNVTSYELVTPSEVVSLSSTTLQYTVSVPANPLYDAKIYVTAIYNNQLTSGSSSREYRSNGLGAARWLEGPLGREALIVDELPSSAASVLLSFYFGDPESPNATFLVPASTFTNKTAVLSEACRTWRRELLASFGTRLFTARWVGADGTKSAAVEVQFPEPFPFVDCRLQLKQNLDFSLRSAMDAPFSLFCSPDEYPLHIPVFPSVNYVYSSFLETDYWFDPLACFPDGKGPISLNFLLRNLSFDANLIGPDGLPATGILENLIDTWDFPYYTPPSDSSILMAAPPALLTNDAARWITGQRVAVHQGDSDWGPIQSGGQGWMLAANNRNFYGLAYQSVKVAYLDGAQVTNYTLVSSQSGPKVNGSVFAEVEPPTYRPLNYYFGKAGVSPFPGSVQFNVTNPIPEILIAGFGETDLFACYAKGELANGAPGVFTYLGQYFDFALKVNASGQITTNRNGQVSPYGYYFPSEPGPVALVTMPDLVTQARGTGVVQVIKLQLDVNHEGQMDLTFGGPDNTSQARPALMFVNNDHDEPASGDQPDRDLDDWGNPPPVLLDYSDGQIRCQRNLEDFARLWICGMPTLPTNQAYSVQLAWSQISSGAPRMRLYWASETNGGIGYLTNTAIAAQQIAEHNTPIGEISPTSTLTLPANVFSNGLTKYFLYEAGGVGSGRLTLTISQGGTNTIAQTSAWFDFHDITDFCEWGLVTNVLEEWPDMVQTNLTSGFRVLSSAKVNSGDAKQLAVFIHGWRMGAWDWFNFSSTMFKRLWWQGYQGRFAALRWPTRNANTELFPQMGYITYNRSERIAFKSGTGAAAYLNDLRSRLPDYTISGCAHSMGGIVTMETLKELAAAGQQPVDNWVLMQAAVPAQCFDPNVPSHQFFLNVEAVLPTPDTYRSYATGITNALRPGGRISNFFNTNDFALSTWEINQSFNNANLRGYGLTTIKPNSFLGYSTDGANSHLSTNSWNLSFWSTIYGGYYLHGPTRAVTNALELMPFVSRPRSLAVGAVPSVHGQVSGEFNLSTLGFGSSPGDHSGEFNRNVQEAPVWPFYSQLRTNLFPQ